jgi:hypothetical protein
VAVLNRGRTRDELPRDVARLRADRSAGAARGYQGRLRELALAEEISG